MQKYFLTNVTSYYNQIAITNGLNTSTTLYVKLKQEGKIRENKYEDFIARFRIIKEQVGKGTLEEQTN